MASTKIKLIEVHNLKNISDLSLDLSGHTVIVTGSNNVGKSTLLRSIPDRIRGEKPELIVKEGEKDGKGTMTLTTGEKFTWEFNTEGKDKLTFYTKDNIKVAVNKDIANRFFPASFDVDKFLQSSPSIRSKMLQKLVGVDFTDVDARYKVTYEKRTAANKEEDQLTAKLGEEPEMVEAVDVATLVAEKEAIREDLNAQYTANKKANEELKKSWEEACAVIEAERTKIAESNDVIHTNLAEIADALNTLRIHGYKGIEVAEWVDSLPKAVEDKTVMPEEPTYFEEMPDDARMKEIDKKIADVAEINQKALTYKAWKEAKEALDKAQVAAADANKKVKEIEAERELMIKESKFPTGITLTEDGEITVDGFLLDRNQISTSKLYIAALRLGELTLGEVRALHFDASPLDRASLNEIQEWAETKDLQLLIERPSFEASEIKYEIVQS